MDRDLKIFLFLGIFFLVFLVLIVIQDCFTEREKFLRECFMNTGCSYCFEMLVVDKDISREQLEKYKEFQKIRDGIEDNK